VGVEDLASLPGSRWLLGGGLNLGDPAQFYAVDGQALRAFAIGWTTIGQPSSACPGPPDPERISINGLALRADGAASGTLYAANHGDRNAVEMFHLDWSDPSHPPKLVWQGCIVLPGTGDPNAIALLRGGGLAVSLFPAATDVAAWREMDAARPAGEIWLWQPGEGLARLDAGAVSGPNGLFAAPEGDVLTISNWAGAEIVTLNLVNGQRHALALGMLPDNIHADADGTLLIVGQRTTPAAVAACSGPVCRQPWSVLRLDPATGAVTNLFDGAGEDAANYGASAVPWQDRLFLTVRGDGRILYLPAGR
jgi:hypothetical protein